MNSKFSLNATGYARFLCTSFVAFFVTLSAVSSRAILNVHAGEAGDPSRGRELFEKRCGGCHSLDVDKEGPRLRNVYGREAGSIASFRYSNALKHARVTWDANTLEKWLVSTEAVVPDNDMDFSVPRADERADIIQYLRTTSGK